MIWSGEKNMNRKYHIDKATTTTIKRPRSTTHTQNCVQTNKLKMEVKTKTMEKGSRKKEHESEMKMPTMCECVSSSVFSVE